MALGLNLKRATGGSAETNLNLGLANPGSGFGTAIRFASKDGHGGNTETFDVLTQPQYVVPGTATTMLFYDADTSMLSAYMDLGNGYFQQGNGVSTSTWGMTLGEEFRFELYATAGSFNDPPAHAFNVDAGEAYFDDFILTVASGEEFSAPSGLISHPRFEDAAPVPEPGQALVGFAVCGVSLAWRRRLARRARVEAAPGKTVTTKRTTCESAARFGVRAVESGACRPRQKRSRKARSEGRMQLDSVMAAMAKNPIGVGPFLTLVQMHTSRISEWPDQTQNDS